jgi:hypothetical protein
VGKIQHGKIPSRLRWWRCFNLARACKWRPSATSVASRLKRTWQAILSAATAPGLTTPQAIIALGKAVKHQALVMGFSDTFAVIGVVLVLAAIAVAFTRKVRASGAGAH